MTYKDGKHTINLAFHGEMHNYQELRKELLEKGHMYYIHFEIWDKQYSKLMLCRNYISPL
ncbi:hypothetical protein CON35_08505 [Bacillus cereus]|nr:hypothetical protein CON35_08505 [Bacillus cereus]